MERLQKFLAHAGLGSRRSCEKLIENKQVKVNGQIIDKLGTLIDPLTDKVEVNNKAIFKKENKVYILLHKPAGYVTTVKDPQGRSTVMDLMVNIKERVYPVGRLDYETEGLLLLTNDGQLSYRLTHPKHKVIKIYEALVKGIPDSSDLKKLQKGVILDDGMTQPAKVKVLEKYADKTLLQLGIFEGRNRQVRRMCRAINHPVLNLKRTQIGPIILGNLPKGSFRHLTPAEVKGLLKSVGLK